MVKICICQLIKDEQRYMQEWIDFYISLGICKFILFEDYNSSSHNEVLSKYGDKVILYKLLDVLNDEEKQRLTTSYIRQNPVWKCFYRLHKDEFDACLFIDVDEFLLCDRDAFINEVQNHIDDPLIKAISYTWLTITASGHIRDPYPNQTYSLKNTYKEILVRPIKDLNTNKKLLIYLKKLDSENDFLVPHNLRNQEYHHISTIRLRHYLTKSWDEFKWRIYNRGELFNNSFSRKKELFFDINQDLAYKKDELLEECKDLNPKYNTNEELIKYLNNKCDQY